MKTKSSLIIAPLYSIGVIALLALILALPSTRTIYEQCTEAHPFIMGFLKFALLATAGELFAVRISTKKWAFPCYIGIRLLIWGIIGAWITYMMKVFSGGIDCLMLGSLLPGYGSRFLRAFYISATMNLSFGPTFMALHKYSDCLLQRRHDGQSCSLQEVANAIDWGGFIKFTLLKTIPLFWIPAHTVTFLLPDAYQVTVAALLSVALGIILSAKK